MYSTVCVGPAQRSLTTSVSEQGYAAKCVCFDQLLRCQLTSIYRFRYDLSSKGHILSSTILPSQKTIKALIRLHPNKLCPARLSFGFLNHTFGSIKKI